jgi:hypothetical protein
VTSEDGRATLPPPPQTDPQPSDLRKLPAHLGWESEPLTQALRHALARRTAVEEQHRALQPPFSPVSTDPDAADGATTATGLTPAPVPAEPPATGEVKLYPDIALAMLRNEQSACGRIWLLLHHLDQARCGWLSLEAARRHLSGPASPWRLCGWRHLRNLWHQGEGFFWQRQNGRIWLHGTAKVAAALGVAHLSQRPVALPVEMLLQGVGIFRAHLYASFHSARCHQGHSSTPVKPIARATLQELSRVSPRSQRAYEERANVRRQANFALATALAQDDEKERAWQHGRAFFSFTDPKGKQGRPGNRYLAWQLPNDYIGPHAPAPQGRQKRINQYLADLFMQGMTGNGKVAGEHGRSGRQRFYGTGLMAAKAYSRTPQADLYWHNGRPVNGRFALWYLLPAQQKDQAAFTGC